jgi:hypothetical protein
VAANANPLEKWVERRRTMQQQARREEWFWDDPGLPFLLGAMLSTTLSLGLWVVVSWASWMLLN